MLPPPWARSLGDRCAQFPARGPRAILARRHSCASLTRKSRARTRACTLSARRAVGQRHGVAELAALRQPGECVRNWAAKAHSEGRRRRARLAARVAPNIHLVSAVSGDVAPGNRAPGCGWRAPAADGRCGRRCRAQGGHVWSAPASDREVKNLPLVAATSTLWQSAGLPAPARALQSCCVYAVARSGSERQACTVICIASGLVMERVREGWGGTRRSGDGGLRANVSQAAGEVWLTRSLDAG